MTNAVKTVRLRVHFSCGLYGSIQTQKTQSINGFISELRAQVSAQNICCGECTLKY